MHFKKVTFNVVLPRRSEICTLSKNPRNSLQINILITYVYNIQLQEAFGKLSKEAAKEKQLLNSVQTKEDNSASLVSELTALVKEQKGRLAELSKAKQEQTAEYRERVSSLEQHLEEARKRMLQLEMLKQVMFGRGRNGFI